MAEEITSIKAIIMVETNKRSIQETVKAYSLGDLKENMTETIYDIAESVGS